MVILIGGVTRTGKTLMAQKLMEKYGYPYMSVDHIKMGLYRGLGDEKYNPEQKGTILAEALWPVIKGIIMTAIENKQNLILEGVYILPSMARDFEREYLDEIVSVFIGFSEEYIKENHDSGILANQSVIEFREDDYPGSPAKLIDMHKEFKQMSLITKVNFFEIKKDYEKEIALVYSYIDHAIKCFCD